MKHIFKILRFDPLKDEAPYFQEYRYETQEKKAILDALMDIRNEQDCTLSFRYSCREAICGSCAMIINGNFDLACRTIIEALDSSMIVIEPMPNLEIQKDLVVDMEPFWQALRDIGPYLFSDGASEAGLNPVVSSEEEDKIFAKGQRIEEKAMDRIDRYIGCIMCGCCYSACPVVTRDERYLGPAALGKLYRFVKDPRDKRPFGHWSRVNTEAGVWGCDTIFRCNEVCPKNVRPADGIEGLRRKMVVEKIKRVFRKKG